MKKNKKQLLNRIALGLVLSTSVCGTVFAVPSATEVPTSPVNVTGANTWVTTNTTDPKTGAITASVMKITQDTATTNAHINWQTFNIGSAATVNIVQNSSNQTLVNQVVSNSMSEIYGKMNASGNVVLVNPNGIILAKGSEINAGGFAAYASNGTKLTDPGNRTSEGNIIADGTINVGVGTAKAMAAKFGVTNFAVGLGEASAFGNANKIALVANGDVTVNANAKLTAVDKTTMTGSSKQGAEGFNMGGVSSSATGTVYIRPDANDNDYGQVYLNGTKLFKANTVNVYYNASVKDTTATTNDGVLYNKKDYANDGGKKWDDMIDTSAVNETDATLDTDAGTVSYKETNPYTVKGDPVVGYALVHNLAQLQDIDTVINGKTNADGKLDGTYALGRDLYAQKDTLGNDYAYVLKNHGENQNPIIFTTTDGKTVVGVSGKDSGIFKKESSGVIDKTLRNEVSITYSNNKVTTKEISTGTGTGSTSIQYSYDGSTIKDSFGNTYTVSTTADGYAVTENGTTTVTDNSIIATVVGLKDALNEFQDQADLTTYLNKSETTVATEFAHMNTSTWNNNQGFDPIGSADPDKAFTGTIFGIGGDVIHIGDGLSEVHTIYDLPINLPTTDNVGLVGYGSGATINYVQEANTSITGHSNVGGLMGTGIKSTISDSSNIGSGINGVLDVTKDSGYVRTTSTDNPVSNIGGLAGDLEDGSSIVESANSATIIGQVVDITNLNVKNVGGLAGTANNTTITRSVNEGNVFGEEKTGGIVGNANNTTIGGGSLDDPTSTVHNNGRIIGTKDTGGIAGYGKEIHMYGVYNTNEDSALSGNSQYVIDSTGKIIGQNPYFDTNAGTRGNKYNANHLTNLQNTGLKGKDIYSSDARSVYGVIEGSENTGGLVGEMAGASTIDTAYNAGNVSGKTDTGGLVGKMTDTGSIKNAYNGDNNTVIREDLGTIPSAVTSIKNASFDPVQSGTSVANSYTYNAGDANYYSFYTQDANTKVKTYYYFIPAGGKTEAGAGGVFVKEDGTFVKNSELPASGDRIYTNRVGYKDANVDGTTNTGGLIGEMTGGTVTATYDTGTVNNGTAGATTGALIGTKTGDSKLTNSFFADNRTSDQTTSITKAYSGQAKDKAVGSGTADTGVAGNSLAYWRKSQNIKNLTGESFVGDAAAVDNKTGFQQFTATDGKTYYWSTKSDVYYYDDQGKVVKYLTYDKISGKYHDAAGHEYTVSGKAVQENTHTGDKTDSSKTFSSEWVYENVSFTDGTAPKLDLTYVKRASNETSDSTWIEYPDETTPLLQHFMFPDNITRNFTYDAKTHNLKTDDVNNVYGRADFTDGVSGKNVNTTGRAQSADPNHQGESVYFYDSTAIWSPQHGYKLNANVSVTIKNTALDIDIQGTRTYGDAGNTIGYYIVVPYQEEKVVDGKVVTDANGNVEYLPEQYAYYKVTDEASNVDYTGTTPYTAMTADDWTYNNVDYRTGTDDAGNKVPATGDLKRLCDAKATYMVTYKGVAALEAVDLNQAVQTVIKAANVTNKKAGEDGKFTSAGNKLTNIFQKQYDSMTNDAVGDQRLDAGTYNVTAVTYDANGDVSNDKFANIGGIENEYNNYTITYTGGLTVNKADLYYTYDGTRVYGDENSTGTHVYTMTGTDAKSAEKSVNGYLKSFDSDKITLNANNAILNGTSTSDGLTATAFDMTGTVNATPNNITSPTGTKGITKDTADTYYHVMVDGDGNVLAYNVSTLNNGTVTMADTNTSATAAAYLNKNYNMVWKPAGTIDARTTTVNATTGASDITTSEVKVNNSTETITPAELKITVTGKRDYGDLMTKDAYTTGASTLADKVYDVTGSGTTAAGSGFKNGETLATLVETSKINTIIDGIEAAAGNHAATQINEATNAGTYSLVDNTVQTASNVNVAGQDAVTKQYNLLATGNYDYKLVNGEHKETINKIDATISETANKDYGTGAEHTVYDPLVVSNVKDWDVASFNADKTITNNSTRTTDVGTYNAPMFSINYASVPTSANYNITQTATLNVNPTTFTYTADHTSYWQYQPIPTQTGKVTNSFGEDVSDLAGTVTWPTPADGKVVGIFPIWGRGTNDHTGNYTAVQDPGNPTALEVKRVPKNDQTNGALNENLEGAWQSFRRPLLDIMYLTIKDNGFKSWDNGVFVTANPYVPAGDKTNYGIITFNGQVLK